MAYNNRNSYPRGSRGKSYGSSYSRGRGGYRGGYGRQGGYNNNQPPVKRSSCEFIKSYKSQGEVVVDENGENVPLMRGWNATRGTFIARPAKDPKKRQTKNPDWETWRVQIFPRVTRYNPNPKPQWTIGLFSLSSKKLIMPELQLVANPNTLQGHTRNGKRVSGYWGKNYRS